MSRPEQIADAAAYREHDRRTGRFLTFCGGGATIGYRMREDPARSAPPSASCARPTRAW